MHLSIVHALCLLALTSICLAQYHMWLFYILGVFFRSLPHSGYICMDILINVLQLMYFHDQVAVLASMFTSVH